MKAREAFQVQKTYIKNHNLCLGFSFKLSGYNCFTCPKDVNVHDQQLLEYHEKKKTNAKSEIIQGFHDKDHPKVFTNF